MAKKKKQKPEHKHEVKKPGFYKKNYKFFLIIPILIFLVSIFFVYKTVQVDGTPIYRDVSLKGGLSARIEDPSLSSISNQELKEDLQEKFPSNSFSISELAQNGEKIGFIIDTDLDDDNLIYGLNSTLSTNVEQGRNYNSNYISPTLSNSFFIQSVYILLVSFGLMSIVIFLYFREFVPSFAVVLSAIFDIIVTVGILDAFNVKVSIAGIGAFLMLIGYSIDTDVLLTNRLIKEEGENFYNKTFLAFKTGILMSLTTLIAGVAALILTNSEVIFEISLILVVGLLVDFISTWVQNAGILLWWLEKSKKYRS